MNSVPSTIARGIPAGHGELHRRDGRGVAALAEAGTIRILDVLILQKGDDGSIDALEIDDLDVVEELVVLEAEIAEILAADDVAEARRGMEERHDRRSHRLGEHLAAPFASAARRAGGQLIASGRIPIQAIIDISRPRPRS